MDVKKALEFQEKLENSIFWIWVKKFKFSFFLIIIILVMSAISLYQIPKESVPKINLDAFTIQTEYRWASVDLVDKQVTQKIEKSIKNIKWVEKITWASNAWFSSIVVELSSWTDRLKFKSDLDDAVRAVDFDSWIKTPKIEEFKIDTALMYKLLVYWDKDKFSYEEILWKGKYLQDKLEWVDWIASAKPDEYEWEEVKILLKKDKVEELWISMPRIDSIIRANLDWFWLWTHKLEDDYFTYGLTDWENSVRYLEDIIISADNYSIVKLSDIAEITLDTKEWNKKIYAWSYDNSWNYWVWLIVNKVDGRSIFEVSENFKSKVEKLFDEDKNLDGLNYVYTYDLYEYLEEDYRVLSENATKTILIVLVVIWLLVSLKEWLLAAFTIPLSFWLAILILEKMGYTLNFLTNFSLVLAFWIAIDAWIVIVEWAYDKLKLWFSSKNAIILTVKEFAPALISWTLTTVAVFIPIIFLPWAMWKFLSFIPITILLALFCALILDLTLTWAIFYKANKSKKTYSKDKELERFLTQEEKNLLEYDRQWKEETLEEKKSKKDKISDKVHSLYYKSIEKILDSKRLRRVFIITPIILLIACLAIIWPRVWVNLFPKWDEWFVVASIEWDPKIIAENIDEIDKKISQIKELKWYTITLEKKEAFLEVELKPLTIRKNESLLSSDEVEKKLRKDLQIFTKRGLSVDIRQSDWWDSWDKPVSIRLVASPNSSYQDLLKTWENLSEQIRNVEWIKYVSDWTSGEFKKIEIDIDKQKAAILWFDVATIWQTLYSAMNGYESGVINIWWPKDIVIKYKEFDSWVAPSEILNVKIENSSWQKVPIWNFASLKLDKWFDEIVRNSWEIAIFLEADVEKWLDIVEIQQKVTNIAQNYAYPEWISFEEWGEIKQNKKLIVSIVSSFFLAIMMIYLILVWQFNSYMQPFMIVYAIFLTLIWVSLGLYFHSLQYSIAFWIWMIAMAWIVVNDDIIFIDKINKNLLKSWEFKHSIISWATSRLQPVFITTVTTVAWVLPLASRDAFWASISYTIVYGLIFGSIFTLFVTPPLYYSLFKKYYPDK